MAIDAAFYAAKVDEYSQDVRQFAGVFENAIKRGDTAEAAEMLKKIEYQSWKLIDHAKQALQA